MQDKIMAITAKGHALIGKTQAGYQIKFTQAVGGDGTAPDDVWGLTKVVRERVIGDILEVKPVQSEGRYDITVCFSNKEVTSPFQLHEVGIFARDPDEGEILYAYGYDGERASYIDAFNGVWYTEDIITVQVHTSNTANIAAVIRLADTTEYFRLDADIAHNLNGYPGATAFEVFGGYGMGGYGETAYGGVNGLNLLLRLEYIDRNKAHIWIGSKDYRRVSAIARVNDFDFVVTFKDNEDSLYLAFVPTYASFNGITGSMDALSAVVADNKHSADNGAVGLQRDLAALTTTVETNKTATDKAVSDLNANDLSLRNDLTVLNTTVGNNKTVADNGVTGLNNDLTALSTTVGNIKTTVDYAVDGLQKDLASLSTTVTNNKAAADKAVSDLNTSLTKRIEAVPVGYGN